MKKYSCILFIVLFLLSCNQTSQDAERAEALVYKEFYGTQFFKDVQLAGIFEDSKTFVDCTPKKPLSDIVFEYQELRSGPAFNLADFVHANFRMPKVLDQKFIAHPNVTMQEHIDNLWPFLSRKQDQVLDRSSLIPLPNEYIVPGGRFREVYYWDSYFTMLGLMENGKAALASSMLDNFAFLIDSLGFIPNGNRAYYLGRSQPPFFAFMVDLVAGEQQDVVLKYQSHLLTEYNFWMEGAEFLSEESPENNRTVLLQTGEVLNRYYDRYSSPRPESFKEDYHLAQNLSLDKSELYRNLRAGAESGWDYSSRWLADKQNMQSIHTTDIIPVDLNALLYFLEWKIAQSFEYQNNLEKADFYFNKAKVRKDGINTLLWNEEAGTYMDYDFKSLSHTGVISMAMAYPLFVQIAPEDKARKVIQLMNDKLLKAGGLVTSIYETGQQWDYPNAWAPLQWIGMQAYFNYDYNKEGVSLIERWLSLNEKVYQQTGKMMEKYNVIDTSLQAGGGEYPLQDGFGWTNGVASAMQKILNKQEKVEQLEMAE